jgi:hypothetical protein
MTISRKDGVTIVAHDNIRIRLAAGTTNGITGAKAAPRAPDALPEADLHRRGDYGGNWRPQSNGYTCRQRAYRR